jgi:hypothetical protein
MDTNYVVWTIGLQDKVWGGYTLVVTYDFQFDAKGATLPVGGVHAVDVERETGSVAITTAASLQLNAKPRATRCGAWTKLSCPPPTGRSSRAPSCWRINTPATNTICPWT